MSGEARLAQSHLRREVRTALELAIAALAPPPVVDRLAATSGILEALEALPSDVPPVRALAESLPRRAQEALRAWREWRAARGLEGV